MPEVPSVSQNLLQQKYGKQQDKPNKDEFQMEAEKGVVSRKAASDERSQAKRQQANAQKNRPSAILDLSPEAKKLLNKN